MLARQLIIVTTDTATGEQVQTNIPYEVSTEATYEQIDTVARQLVSLIRNTYVDTYAVNTVSVNEQLENN